MKINTKFDLGMYHDVSPVLGQKKKEKKKDATLTEDAVR